MKITNILAFAGSKLRESAIDSHRLDSLILLGHSLNFTKEQIIFNPDLSLTIDQQNNFFSLIERRLSGEPVSHIIGKREFFGNNFIINSSALDPRADSETLIEAIINYFPDKKSKLEILELGVGSGCLMLSILKIFSNSLAIGIDISEEALNVAIKNSYLLGLENNAKFIKSNWFDELEGFQKFDLIISNPPYIASKDIEFLQKEVKDHEPLIALDGGIDGLDCYKKIAENVVNFLKKRAILVLEIGQNQEESVTKIFNSVNLQLMTSKKDLGGIVRCLIFRNNENI